MTSPVLAVSPQSSVTPAAFTQAAPAQAQSAFSPTTTQQDSFSPSQMLSIHSPKRGWISWGLGLAINTVKRLWNGARNVIGMFMPGQIGRTMRDTAIWTAGLSVFSFFLTGPLHIPAIPLYAVASLGFDAAGKFIAGMWVNPNRPNLHHVQANQLGFMTPEQRKALGYTG